MNSILVIALTVGVVTADIGIGYNQKVVPQTSYGVPSYHTDSTSSSSGGSYRVQSADQGNYQSGYQGVLIPGQYYQSQLGAAATTRFGGNTESVGQAAYQNFNQYQSSNRYQSAVDNQAYYPQIQEQPAKVFKHFYVHAAPEEPETPRVRQPVTLPAPEKHYKIIFIKTPSPPAYPAQVLPIPQQNEEKTIVYVLVNKPEDPQDIVLPTIKAKPPAKPEVFFIKYNNKDDTQSVINNIVSDYNNGESVSFTSASSSEGSAEYSQGGELNHFTQVGRSGKEEVVTGQSLQSAGSFGAVSDAYSSTSGINVGTVDSSATTRGSGAFAVSNAVSSTAASKF